MKKNLLFILALFFALSMQAQVKLAPMLGFNISGAKYKIGNSPFTSKSGAGFNIGLLADISAGDMFSFMPGIVFSTHSLKEEATIATIPYKNSYKMSYISIPLNFLYKAEIGEDHLFAGLGPNLGIGAGGTQTVSFTAFGGQTFSNDTSLFGSQKGALKRFDLGLNIMAGYRLASGIMLSLQYTGGLMNLSNDPDNTTWRNSSFNINFLYFFNNDED